MAAHHQRHGNEAHTHVLSDPAVRPVSTTMPSISEDDLVAEADEPPDSHLQKFTKTVPTLQPRRQSLLSKGLHTDSEPHDDDPLAQPGSQDPLYRSSTASTYSGRSTADMTSDDGLASPATRSSTPSSPPPSSGYFQSRAFLSYNFPSKLPLTTRPRSDSDKASAQISQASTQISPTQHEPAVEAELGRKRCISFACGGKSTVEGNKSTPPTTTVEQENVAPPKRKCMIQFACSAFRKEPSNKPRAHEETPKTAEGTASPPPPKSPSRADAIPRHHRDSDTTIKNASPTAVRRSSQGSSDEEVDDWIQESTAYRSRLTVHDTLKKEIDIRLLGEECEKEALEDEEAEDDKLFGDAASVNQGHSDRDFSDGGFQTDDEGGFAESDEDSGSNSDNEWWAPRRPTGKRSPATFDRFRPVAHRSASESSLESNRGLSPRRPQQKSEKHKKSRPIVIRPGTPDLPDSTDFVCGTLDEDRPLEQAYLAYKEQRKAAKHKPTPQDIDPTFPTSDPEIEDDEPEDEEDEVSEVGEENEQDISTHNGPENTFGERRRGRDRVKLRKASPFPSPKRMRSPPALADRSPASLSPTPRPLFARSPTQVRSPPPPNRLTSPPPSRHGSPSSLRTKDGFLGRRPLLTHTASLPRSPCPFRRRTQAMTKLGFAESASHLREDGNDNLEVEDGPTPETAYTRGAIDIVQGLERKRLRRRQKFYEKYLRHEGKKQHRKPQPGKGAQRMRQIGIECAIYRGKRVLSV